jgi:ketosteroid isomerase-like protein
MGVSTLALLLLALALLLAGAQTRAGSPDRMTNYKIREKGGSYSDPVVAGPTAILEHVDAPDTVLDRAGASSTGDPGQIAMAIADFTAAYNRGDLTSILAYYTEDLIKLRQGAPPETKKEIADRLRSLFASYTGTLTVQTDEIIVEHSVAFTRGSLRVVLTPRAAGTIQTIDRRYVELWRKEGGRWRVARAMDNTP